MCGTLTAASIPFSFESVPMISLGNFLAVAFGGMVGSIARWLTSVWLNPVVSGLPLGTLAVNMVGGYVIGFALAVFAANPATPTEARLLVTSGFCGGFTTFSAFSSEVVTLFVANRLEWALATMASNVIGALVMTYLGMKTYQLIG